MQSYVRRSYGTLFVTNSKLHYGHHVSERVKKKKRKQKEKKGRTVFPGPSPIPNPNPKPNRPRIEKSALLGDHVSLCVTV